MKDKNSNINSFLNNEVNISIFKKYNQHSYNFDVLDLFNKLKREFEFFNNNSENYISIFNHFQSEILKKHKKSYAEYMSSTDLFRDEIHNLQNESFFYDSLYSQLKFHFEELNTSEIQKQSLNLIKETREEIESYFSSLLSRTFELDDIENIEDLIAYLDDLNDIDEKIEAVLKIKYKLIESNELKDESNEFFIYQCNLELEKLKELKSIYANKNVSIEKSNTTEKHENIFSNNGFILFEHILNQYVKPKPNRGRLSDIHFFYWSLYENKPQLIHQRPQRFKEWFFDNYDNEDLGKIKTFQQVANADRLKHYSNALEWFKTLT